MTWKLTKQADGMEPLPGVPWRSMDDEEFRQEAKAYAERNPGFPARALHNSGFFEHDQPEKAAADKEG